MMHSSLTPVHDVTPPKWRRLSALSPLVLGTLLWAGCPEPTPLPDAGPTPSPDAGVPDDAGPPDAGTGDGGVTPDDSGIVEVMHQLTLTFGPDGDGRVFDSDGNVDCDDDCVVDIREGTVLTLQAEAGVDHKFDGWTGACTGTDDCVVTIDADTDVGVAFSQGTTAEELSPSGDLDGDGLTNGEELNTYGTSPWLVDTDGDGYTDHEELVTYGFDATNDPFKFNPLVADVPKIRIHLVSPPGISLDMTSSVSGSTTVTAGSSRETSTEVSTSESTTNTTSVERSLSRSRASTGFAPLDYLTRNVGINKYKSKKTETESFSWSQTQSVENTQAYNESVAVTEEQGFTYEGGRLSMLVQVENSGNIAFTLDNLVLSATQQNAVGDAIEMPLGNLGFDAAEGGAFPQTTLGPGDVRDTLVFDKDDLDLQTTLALLKDSRGLNVSAASYELTDANGVAFNHALTEVRAKTALVIVDYGPGTGRAPEHHMVATNIVFSDPGVVLGDVFDGALHMPYATSDGLTGVRDVDGDVDSRQDWSVLHAYKDAGEDRLAFYNAAEMSFDFDAIELRAGDVLHLVFRDDADDDGLGAREEFLFGANTTLADTDDDGLSDGEEVYGVTVAGLTVNDAVLYTSPVAADTDDDGFDDADEIAAGGDPTSAFPRELASGGNAEALDVVTDAQGNAYVVGYGDDLPSANGRDWWLKKMRPDGEDVWDRRFDGGNDGDLAGYGHGGMARGVALSPTGDVYVVGYHSLGYNIATQEYWWIKKFNAATGDEITAGWDKDGYRDVNGANDSAHDVAVDAAGNVYVVGFASKLVNGSSGKDWWVRKFTADGTEATTGWNKSFSSAGTESDEARAVVVDDAGNVYVGGFGVNLVSGTSSTDWRIVKYNSNGDVQWETTYDGAHGGADRIYDMALDSAGDLYVAGTGYGLAFQGSGTDGVVRKVDGGTGEVVAGWQHVIAGQAMGVGDVAEGITVDAEDNVYVAATRINQGSEWVVRKYDVDGVADPAVHSLTLPRSYDLEYAKAISVAPGGVVFVVGNAGFIPPAGQGAPPQAPYTWWVETFYDVTLDDN